MLVAERLSARLLIVQRSQLAFVCMYIYIYVYPSHFDYVGAVSVVSSQTTSHVVLVRPGGDRKIVRVREPKRSRGHMVLVGAGGDRRVKKIVREPKWSRSSQSVIVLESEDGNKGTLHQKRVRQRRKSLTDTCMTLRSLPETLQTTALPSSSLYLVSST